jgi:hypothetical protein
MSPRKKNVFVMHEDCILLRKHQVNPAMSRDPLNAFMDMPYMVSGSKIYHGKIIAAPSAIAVVEIPTTVPSPSHEKRKTNLTAAFEVEAAVADDPPVLDPVAAEPVSVNPALPVLSAGRSDR